MRPDMRKEPMDTTISFSLVSKLSHWVMAVLITALIIVGFIMTNVPKDYAFKMDLVVAHKSFGVIAVVLGPISLFWILFRRYTPKYPESMNIWSIFIARVTKIALIAIIIIMPWSGYIMATAAGRNLSFF